MKEGECKGFKIHRLVAMTFIENTNRFPIVNHKDENKHNNNVDNLEWCDDKYNVTYSKGKKVNKLDINTGEILETFDSIRDAEKSLSKGNSSRICNGNGKEVYGYKWSWNDEKIKEEINSNFLNKFTEIEHENFVFYGKILFLTYESVLNSEDLKEFILDILPKNTKNFHIIKNEPTTYVLIKFQKRLDKEGINFLVYKDLIPKVQKLFKTSDFDDIYNYFIKKEYGIFSLNQHDLEKDD